MTMRHSPKPLVHPEITIGEVPPNDVLLRLADSGLSASQIADRCGAATKDEIAARIREARKSLALGKVTARRGIPVVYLRDRGITLPAPSMYRLALADKTRVARP